MTTFNNTLQRKEMSMDDTGDRCGHGRYVQATNIWVEVYFINDHSSTPCKGNTQKNNNKYFYENKQLIEQISIYLNQYQFATQINKAHQVQ